MAMFAMNLFVNIKDGEIVCFTGIPLVASGALEENIFVVPGNPFAVIEDVLLPFTIVNKMRSAELFDFVTPISSTSHSERSWDEANFAFKDLFHSDPRSVVIKHVYIDGNFMLLLFTDKTLKEGA